MPGYIGVPIETDPTELAADALDSMTESIPGFVPREGHLEVWMVEVWARMVAQARDVASSVPTTIFRYFGETMIGIAPVAGASATAPVTFTAIDTQGYTVPAETNVAFRTAGDELVLFRTLEDTVISPGSSVVGGVLVEALEEGSVPNGLGPGAMEMVDALAFVVSVVADEASSGGVDAETDDEYLDRLTQELQLLSPRPILPDDFAVLARRIIGVHRARALDGYNPTDGTYDNERTVAIALVDEDGNPVTPETAAAAQAYLDDQREVNFLVYTMDPTYTPVDVAFAAVALPASDLVDVETRAEEALSAYLSPATWGGGDQSPPEWRTTANVIRYLELAQVLNAVDGVDYVTSLTLNGAAADLALSGVAPLPQVGTVDGTVTYG